LIRRAYNLFDRQNVLNFRDIFKQFKTTSLEEVNYLNEAAIASHYYEAYKDHPHLVIPKTYKELCTSRVIVQECLVGESLTKMLAMKNKGEDAKAYVTEHLNSDLLLQLEVVGTELLGQAVTGQIMHADPHPGNIILMRDNKVALIDFGMSTVLSTNRVAFYQMLVQYVDFYSGDFTIGDLALSAFKFLQRDLFEAITQAEDLLRADGQARQPIMDKIKVAVTEIFYDESNSVIISQLMASKSLMRMLFFTINRGNRFGFSFDLEAINLIKAAQGYALLMANFDSEGTAMTKVLENVVKIAEANFDLVIDSKEAKGYYDPQASIEILSCWIDKMARSDPVFMNKLTMEHTN
jgi:tRNA A-37 threonylcarbamoyl transferase component Bud32